MNTYLRKIARKMLSLPNLSNSALYSAEVNLVYLHDYRFKKVIDFRLNTEDPILNDQLKLFDNTTCKVKKGKPAKNISLLMILYTNLAGRLIMSILSLMLFLNLQTLSTSMTKQKN
jgi:hypothetical protein